jgi:predicted permease
MLADIRFSLRNLRKSPMFTTIAILSIALGIGANTAIFTLFDHLLLRLLPVRDAAELVYLKVSGPFSGSVFGANVFSYAQYQEIRKGNPVFSGVTAFLSAAVSFSNGTQTQRARAELVSGNYFEVMGLSPAAGRLLTDADDQVRGGHPVAVISHDFWIRRFGGQADAVNREVKLNGLTFTVVGIAPQGFPGSSIATATDLFVPLAMKKVITPTWDQVDNRAAWFLNLMARMKPGLSREQAQVGLNTFLRGVFEADLKAIEAPSQRFRDRYLAKQVTLDPGGQGRTERRAGALRPLTLLMAMVGMVLLIACANVANLLLARAAGRQKEIAVRLALGASRGRLIRQLLMESVILSLAAGGAGVLISYWCVDLLIQAMPTEVRVFGLTGTPDLRVLSFAFGLSLLTGLVFGLVPALQATRPVLAPTLKDQAANLGSGGQARLRKGLVAAQVALSLLLLIGAGLFARSLFLLRSTDLGLRLDRILTFSLDPLLNGYKAPQSIALFEKLQQAFTSMPGVEAASLAYVTPLADDMNMSTVAVEGYQAKEGEDVNPLFNAVGPGYFQALGIPMLQGRDFSAKDGLTAPKVAIVNKKFVDYFFKGQNPIGRHFTYGRQYKPEFEIVGVVGDSKYANVREANPRQVFLPYSQDETLGQMTFFVRTSGDPTQLAAALREEVRRADANLPVFGVKTMEAQADESLFAERMVASLATAAGALATLLAAVGLYGVMAYSVARRTREIGVRMALGAQRSNVLGLVMREVAILAAAGIAIALPLSLYLTRFVKSQLYGISEHDALTLAAATLLLAGIALLAGYLPARRATRIDPMVALRYE